VERPGGVSIGKRKAYFRMFITTRRLSKQGASLAGATVAPGLSGFAVPMRHRWDRGAAARPVKLKSHKQLVGLMASRKGSVAARRKRRAQWEGTMFCTLICTVAFITGTFTSVLVSDISRRS